MRFTCHFVPALACVFVLVGCYDTTGDERCPAPAGMVCCGGGGAISPEPGCPFRCPPGSSLAAAGACDAVPPVDAGSGGDAGPWRPDGGGELLCPLRRADATCLMSYLVEPEVAFDLPIAFAGCGCCSEIECAVEVDASAGTIGLTTTLCPDPCDCDGCNPIEGSCRVPPLGRGTWNVTVNGAPAFELPVAPPLPGLAPPPACVSYAAEDPCGLVGAPIPLTPSAPDSVCVRRHDFLPDAALVELDYECPGCNWLGGTCAVTVEPRFTDDLPPGGEIRIAATEHVSGCETTCPPVCTAQTRSCPVPDLEPGGYYRVWYDGAFTGVFIPGASGSGPVCGTPG